MRHVNRLFLAGLLAASFAGSINAEEVSSVEGSACATDLCVTSDGTAIACADVNTEVKSYSHCGSPWHKVWQWRWNPRDGWHRHSGCGCH